MHPEAFHRLIMSLDVEGSGALPHDRQRTMRSTLDETIAGSFAAVGIADAEYHDRGDGAIVLIRPEVAKARVLGPWLTELEQGLLARRRAMGAGAAVRVRVGVHAGEVEYDANGMLSTDINLACRLEAAGVTRATLAAAPGAVLVVVVSDPVYQSVVRDGGRFLRPEHYREVRVQAKETDTRAWICVPGYSVPPLPADDDEGGSPVTVGDGPERAGTVWNIGRIGTSTVFDGSTLNGDVIIGGRYGGEA
jgi:hypothetical protein